MKTVNDRTQVERDLINQFILISSRSSWARSYGC